MDVHTPPQTHVKKYCSQPETFSSTRHWVPWPEVHKNTLKKSACCAVISRKYQRRCERTAFSHPHLILSAHICGHICMCVCVCGVSRLGPSRLHLLSCGIASADHSAQLLHGFLEIQPRSPCLHSGHFTSRATSSAQRTFSFLMMFVFLEDVQKNIITWRVTSKRGDMGNSTLILKWSKFT